jgi:hypothetical protein
MPARARNDALLPREQLTETNRPIAKGGADSERPMKHSVYNEEFVLQQARALLRTLERRRVR